MQRVEYLAARSRIGRCQRVVEALVEAGAPIERRLSAIEQLQAALETLEKLVREATTEERQVVSTVISVDYDRQQSPIQS